MRAGLTILEAIADLNEADPKLDLQVRVGINTGEAVADLAARPEQAQRRACLWRDARRLSSSPD